jgi:membrane peptidoglycan carboxypeptidase
MLNENHAKDPTHLPERRMAALAQRLSDRSLKPVPGYWYDVPNHSQHARGWHVRRYLKRKRLRHSHQSEARVERTRCRWLIVPAAALVLAAILSLTSMLVGYVSWAKAVNKRYYQQVVTLPDLLPGDNLKMYDEHGRLIYQMVSQGLQTSEPLSKISPELANAEVAMEDKTFWTNPGIDITAIVRAALSDLEDRRIVSGGSTITQQLIKNVIVGNRVSMIRKLKELVLAPEATRRYTKQQILDMYLNTTYYGEGAYGAEAAAFIYYDLHDTPTQTTAQQLDLAQAAMLAGIPANPSLFDPFVHPKAAFYRAEDTLNRMRALGYITGAQEYMALLEMQQPHFLHRGVVNNSLAPQFAQDALNELANALHVPLADLPRSGLSVDTTLNLHLQNEILAIARQHIDALSQAHNITNAAAVLINFHNGAIRVLLGNIDPTNPQWGQFDVATQGYRQPGSSFKPFVYATAFEKGLSPGMPVLDASYSISLCCGLPPYTPHNYDMRYHGLISIRTALQNSFNVPAVKVLVKTGVQASLHTAEEMGITSYKGTPNYTMVLGSLGIHLLDETAAYGVFATGGIRIPAHTIDKVINPQGQVIYQFVPHSTRVLSPQVAFLITNVLSDNAARAYEFGLCSWLYLYSQSRSQCDTGDPGVVRPAAVKTGTSENFMDNWTVGYTTDYVMGVWAGNNNNSPMVNVEGVTGAGYIWHYGMLLAEQGHPIRQFPIPRGVVRRTITYPDGLTTTDWYIQGMPIKNWGLG